MIKKLLCIATIACFSNSMAQNIELRNHNGYCTNKWYCDYTYRHCKKR